MNLSGIANEIYRHQKDAVEMDQFSSRYTFTLEDAYKIQAMNIERDLQEGDKFAGWKMGLTSLAKQRSVGLHQPIHGRLLKSMEISNEELSLEGLIHPRVEPEFAFLMKEKLEGNNITKKDVWRVTECIMPALEIIDSRFKDFSFNHIDVVADNASSARYLINNQRFSPNQFQWDKINVQMKLNDKVVQVGKGSDVLGSPVQSVVELVKMLHLSGLCLDPGMIVLTGAITEAVSVSAGDFIEVEFNQLGKLYLNVR